MWFSTSSGIIELNITKAQAEMAAHSGDCQDAVEYLRTIPKIRRQLDAIDPETLAEELREYGAWDEGELADHDFNKTRILWLACCEISEQYRD